MGPLEEIRKENKVHSITRFQQHYKKNLKSEEYESIIEIIQRIRNNKYDITEDAILIEIQENRREQWLVWLESKRMWITAVYNPHFNTLSTILPIKENAKYVLRGLYDRYKRKKERTENEPLTSH